MVGWVCGRCGVENPFRVGRCRACGIYSSIPIRAFNCLGGYFENVSDSVLDFLETHPDYDAFKIYQRTLRVIRVVAVVASVACVGLAAYVGIEDRAVFVGRAERLGSHVQEVCVQSWDAAQGRQQALSMFLYADKMLISYKGRHLVLQENIEAVRNLSDSFDRWAHTSSLRAQEKRSRLEHSTNATRRDWVSALSSRMDYLRRRVTQFNLEELQPTIIWGRWGIQ